MKKLRLDELLSRMASVSLSKAQGLIHTRNVSTTDGQIVTKPGEYFAEDTVFVIAEGRKYVSRGGQKLEAAFKEFDITCEGAHAIDVGASTGGFTDCLLQHGAAKVYAVDVGYGQLDWKLRQDPRVTVFERTNIRDLDAALLDPKPSFFTVDCSFISLGKVIEALGPLLLRPCAGVVLIKPQFEAPKEDVEPGGVVTDPRVHEEVVSRTTDACRRLGFEVEAVLTSPLRGPAGNIEFLGHLTRAD